MQTLQPMIKSGRAVWNAEALPRQEFQDRLVRLRAQMAAKGLDLLFVYGRPFNDKADPCYLSNFVNQLARGTAVMVRRQGEPALLVDGFPRALPTMRSLTWIKDVRTGGTFAAMVSKYLNETGSSAASIGLVGARSHMPFEHYRALREALKNSKVSDVDDLVADLRRVKSERETGRIRAAGRAVTAMFTWLGGQQRPGLTERAIHVGARLVARRKGAEDVRFLLARPGEGECGLRPAEDKPLAEDEHIFIYVAAEMDRYWAEAVRTLVLKKDRLIEFNPVTARPVYESMLRAAASGNQGDAPVLAVRAGAAAAGLNLADDYGYGNGLGLSLDEAPAIADQSPDCFQPGMSLSLRLMTRDLGGLMLGDSLLINSRGHELVTRI